jgi:tetratricopeptide (TPR) repeat protein
MGLIDKFGDILGSGKSKGGSPKGKAQERYLDLVQKEPENAKAHLKLAEIYQKKGEKHKAVEEYLLAADIFAKNNFFARAMAIYKQVPKQDPSLDHVYLKIADIYRKMGFLGDALAQYRLLVQFYDRVGKKDKALEIMSLMAEVDSRKSPEQEKIKGFKGDIRIPTSESGTSDQSEAGAEKSPGEKKKEFSFDLGAELEAAGPTENHGVKEIFTSEKVSGVEEIFKELKETSGPSTVDPHFNYNMGVACRELGRLDDAIEQFQTALNRGQSPFEAASMLGLCFKEKGMWDPARQAFEKALKVPAVSQEKRQQVKYELGLLYKEQGKTEEALEILREISAGDRSFQGAKNEIAKFKGHLKDRMKSSRK